MAHVAADVDRTDRRAARGRRRAFQPVGPARRSAELARPVVRPGAAGGAGRHRPGDAARPGRPGQDAGILPKLKARLTARVSKRLNQLEAALELCPEIRAEIEAALVDDPPLAVKEGGLIRDGYHPDSTSCAPMPREASRGSPSFRPSRSGARASRASRSDSTRFSATTSRSRTPRPRHEARAFPSDYIRKQTVKNAERYITPELKEYEEKVLRAEDRAFELEYELFTTLRDRVSAEAPRLIQAGAVLAQLDVLASLAELAARHGYCRPEIVAEPVFEVEAGRHPVLDAILSPGRLRAQRRPARRGRRARSS